ncbi:hypothetical protein EVJ58_g4347 [Rhodofomes roseus]|uniref:Uncharacterized protein n=1 Tax=Rhodofomes roseus TaxID=34475 RepID=A0A4Y9YL66_9APHY|nr:hypothetical protein EVJ58_g4347 [Rhodofomes roseus]
MLAGSVSLIAEANGDVKSGDDGGKEAESDDEHEDLTEEEDGGHWQAHRHSGIFLGSTL